MLLNSFELPEYNFDNLNEVNKMGKLNKRMTFK